MALPSRRPRYRFGARPCRRCREQLGFTYLALLFAVAVAGTLLAATGVLWRTDGAREREAELLFAGRELQRGLESYFAATPQEPRRYPKTLEELLEDHRGPVLRRHLRRIYFDPFTGKPDWTLLRAPDGTITGLHSSVVGVPIKRADPFGTFPFAGAKTYQDWIFRPRSEAQQAAAGESAAAAPGSGAPPAVAGIGVPITAAGDPAAHELPRPQVVLVVPGKPAPEPPLEKPPQPNCVIQRASDGKVCQGLREQGNFASASQCLISATQRFLACERGDNIPPLRSP